VEKKPSTNSPKQSAIANATYPNTYPYCGKDKSLKPEKMAQTSTAELQAPKSAKPKAYQKFPSSQ
jgi:hypothetical protein